MKQKRYLYKSEITGWFREVYPELVARMSPQPHWFEIPKCAECFAVWEDDPELNCFYKDNFKEIMDMEFNEWVDCGYKGKNRVSELGGKIVWVEKGFENLLENEPSQQEEDKPKFSVENTKLFINGVEFPFVKDVNFEPPKLDLEYKPFNPLDVQEGGSHYKQRGIQPIEYTEANKLNFQQGNVVKYITRHKEKNGVEDLGKVVHYALLEAYFTYGIEGSTKLKQKILKMLGESNE
ncbi:MAG: DUF3310 domain-containing protein [Bacteroidales bacterium]|nr:DUF3310 domain-containing protein [Candidatus Scybalousia scybalohippi]